MPIQSANPPDLLTLTDWAGCNQSTRSRSSIADQETWWQENWFPYAPGQLRTAWGPSAPIYTAPGGTVIQRIFFGRVNDTQGPVGLMFRSDGSVDQVQLSNGAVTNLGAGIWGGGGAQLFAAAKVWSPQQVGFTAGQPGGWVIGSASGALYAWDGTTLTGPGQAAPGWLTNNVATTMPSVGSLPGIWGMEIWQNRLWVFGKTVFAWSAPYNGADFSTANGGGAVAFAGDQLRISYTDMAASGGFLYLFGDSMTNVISALQLSGTGTVTAPFTTTFLDSNVNPQIGQRFWRPVGRWDQSFAAYTGMGIYIISGNTTQSVSQKMTELYNTLQASPFLPTISAATIFGQRYMLFLAEMRDNYGVNRPLILAWNGQSWTIASQRYALTNIGSYEEMSTITPYGTDGAGLYQLFAQPDPALRKLLLTKAYVGRYKLSIKDFKRVYCEIRDYSTGPEGVSLTGVLSTGGGGIPNGSESLSFQVEPKGYVTVGQPAHGKGLWAALDLITLSPDFALESVMIAYEDRSWFGA